MHCKRWGCVAWWWLYLPSPSRWWSRQSHKEPIISGLALTLERNKGLFPLGCNIFLYFPVDQCSWISPKITPDPKMLVHAWRSDLSAARFIPTECTGDKSFKGLSASGHGKALLKWCEGVAAATLQLVGVIYLWSSPPQDVKRGEILTKTRAKAAWVRRYWAIPRVC